MPQVRTESYSGATLRGTSTYQMTPFSHSEGRLGADGSAITMRDNSHGIMMAVAKVFSRSTNTRRTPEAENKHIARLPKVATDKIIAYLADPFERATLAMTCRFLHQQLKPYWPEFQLFRDLIASKKSLDFRAQSSCMKEVTLWLNLLTGDRWSSWRAKTVFVETLRRLGKMYPRTPERAFHEVWSLFGNLTRKAKLEALEEVFRAAMARSPYWAATVLTEFARRAAYQAKPAFYDKLLDLAMPLIRNPDTAKISEPLVGAIAGRLDPETLAQDEARWKRILQLVPPSTPIESEAVLGLANTAVKIQRRWEKHDRKMKYGFPAVTMMQDRFKGFPSYESINAFANRVWRREEREIDNRRLLRYMATEQYAIDCADRQRAHEEILANMYARNIAPQCETAGGG